MFGVLFGIKRQVYGSDGYTSFVPPDSEYDPARVAMHLRNDPPIVPPGERGRDPAIWRYPAIDRLCADLSAFAADTRKILFFVPYNQKVLPPSDAPGAAAWRECKQRVAALAARVPNTLAVDFMRQSPITSVGRQLLGRDALSRRHRRPHRARPWRGQSRRGFAGLRAACQRRPCVSPPLSVPPAP